MSENCKIRRFYGYNLDTSDLKPHQQDTKPYQDDMALKRNNNKIKPGKSLDKILVKFISMTWNHNGQWLYFGSKKYEISN